jgi:hypothetical protein
MENIRENENFRFNPISGSNIWTHEVQLILFPVGVDAWSAGWILGRDLFLF